MIKLCFLSFRTTKRNDNGDPYCSIFIEIQYLKLIYFQCGNTVNTEVVNHNTSYFLTQSSLLKSTIASFCLLESLNNCSHTTFPRDRSTVGIFDLSRDGPPLSKTCLTKIYT